LGSQLVWVRSGVPPWAVQLPSSWMLHAPSSKQHAKPSPVKSITSWGGAEPSRVLKRRADGSPGARASSPRRIQPWLPSGSASQRSTSASIAGLPAPSQTP
jgi:hypothetical protein